MSSCHPVILKDLSKVPPFPPVAARLLALLKDPDIDVGEVAEIIRNDAKLTARLLQSSNSALFSINQPVNNVAQAIALLGFERTLQIAVMNATASYTKRGSSTVELLSCWQHSMATALIADEIAKSCEVSAQATFSAGILHDIGRLGMIVAYPREYERVMRGATAENCLDPLDFEREHFGIDHAEAGRFLAETWDLPQEFCIVAGRHHDRCEGTGARFAPDHTPGLPRGSCIRVHHVPATGREQYRRDLGRAAAAGTETSSKESRRIARSDRTAHQRGGIASPIPRLGGA